MRTNRLEEFVKNNRELFDNLEPSQKVWDNISENTRKPRVISISRRLLKIAAVVTVVLATSVIALQSDLFFSNRYANSNADPEIRELIEAEAFYAHQVNGKLKEIKKCYYTFPELKNEIEGDLNELEEMYNVLKADLKENVANKTVIEAMIDNNRTRLELVDDVLQQIKC